MTPLCTCPCTPLPCAVQAQKLDEMLAKRGQSIDSVLNFVVPDSLLVGVKSCWVQLPSYLPACLWCLPTAEHRALA